MSPREEPGKCWLQHSHQYISAKLANYWQDFVDDFAKTHPGKKCKKPK